MVWWFICCEWEGFERKRCWLKRGTSYYCGLWTEGILEIRVTVAGVSAEILDCCVNTFLLMLDVSSLWTNYLTTLYECLILFWRMTSNVSSCRTKIPKKIKFGSISGCGKNITSQDQCLNKFWAHVITCMCSSSTKIKMWRIRYT